MPVFRNVSRHKRIALRGRNRHTGFRRSLCCERLEARRLLVGEGEVFAFNNSYNTAGIVGDVSAEIRWGDGTTSPATSVSGGNTTGNLRIRFDYSLDTGGFFSGAGAFRRGVLQAAADTLIQRFGDDLAAITPVPGFKEWEPSVFHPSSGPANQLAGTLTSLGLNRTVAANEIVIYAGARDLPGAARGVGGPASFRFPSVTVTCTVQAECDRKLAEIEVFKDAVRSRGEAGVLLPVQTDVAPNFGSVAFDNQTDWYFGTDPNGIQPNQIDFISAATHEIAHVLGFGITRDAAITSWVGLTQTGVFNGPRATAAYAGSGPPPIESNHWSPTILTQANQRTLMAGEIPVGERQVFTELDFAAMDDLGWDLLSTQANVSGQHRFADDGVYEVELVLRGSRANEVVHPIGNVTVTNTAPSLTIPGTQTVTVGQPLTLTNLGQLSDPGFSNANADPVTEETFTATVNWGDGSPLEVLPVSIDAQGNAAGALTLASFDGVHTYETVGTKTVVVQVSDDDGGTDQASFTVVVSPPPALTLQLSAAAIDEDDGSNAATLTIRRSGPANASPQTINLSSTDVSEATVPASAVIPANATSVSVSVQAVDDALKDGDVTLQLRAEASGVESGEIDLLVRDRESLTASFSSSEIAEDAASPVNLIVRRSNTDTQQPLNVTVSGGAASQLNMPASVTIPAGQQQVAVAVSPVNDEAPEPSSVLSYTLSAVGYAGATTSITLLDDEAPLFQNQNSPFDVDDSGEVTAFDALSVIIALAERGTASAVLNPLTEQPNGVFIDANGDYLVSAADALLIINELARLLVQQTAEPEDLSVRANAPLAESMAPKTSLQEDEGDPRDFWRIDVGLLS